MYVSFCSKEKVGEVCGSIYHYISFKIMESINALRAVFSYKNVILIKLMYKFLVVDINVNRKMKEEIRKRIQIIFKQHSKFNYQ